MPRFTKEKRSDYQITKEYLRRLYRCTQCGQGVCLEKPIKKPVFHNCGAKMIDITTHLRNQHNAVHQQHPASVS